VLKILEYLSSAEYQTAQARIGVPSVLDAAEAREQFGADTAMFAGKNVKAFFTLAPSAPPSRIGKYERLEWMLSSDQDAMLVNAVFPAVLQTVREGLDPSAAAETIERELAKYLERMRQLPADSY